MPLPHECSSKKIFPVQMTLHHMKKQGHVTHVSHSALAAQNVDSVIARQIFHIISPFHLRSSLF